MSPRKRHNRFASRRRPSGFTLVEVMIVIVAMSILAAVVIPQVQSALDDAKRSAMLTDLHILTKAIEHYRLDHDASPPNDLSDNTLLQLTTTTDVYGNIGTGPAYEYGPYLLSEVPANPLNDSAIVFPSSSDPPGNPELFVGWLYHIPSGRIWAGERRE
jgi:type II secretion system protein G